LHCEKTFCAGGVRMSVEKCSCGHPRCKVWVGRSTRYRHMLAKLVLDDLPIDDEDVHSDPLPSENMQEDVVHMVQHTLTQPPCFMTPLHICYTCNTYYSHPRITCRPQIRAPPGPPSMMRRRSIGSRVGGTKCTRTTSTAPKTTSN
jgi:hypothetical protein